MVFMMKNLTVLYAEDDLFVLENTAKTLSYFFNTVLIARDGLEAIEMLKKHSIDILITDYIMPKKNGYDVVCEAKRLYPKIIVFVTSSYTDSDILIKCIPLGISEYLVKPINYDQLLATLEKVSYEKQFFVQQINSFVSYDIHLKSFIVEGKEITLSPHQIKLIECLLKHRGTVVSKTTLMNYIYGEIVDENLFKNLILRLRKKAQDELFSVVKGIGYILK